MEGRSYQMGPKPWRGYYLTAYGIAVKNGFKGTEEEWLESLIGEDGKSVELRYSKPDRMIQWKHTDSVGEWQDLVPLAELQAVTINGYNVSTLTASGNIELEQSDGAMMLKTTPELDAAVKWASNRNLLDNGYFVGGGSQQGGGQFPINQRGETEYTQNGYCIDRWAIAATPNGTVSLDKNGLRLETKGNYGYLIQKIEPYRTQVGKILTFSVLLTNGKLLSTSGIFPAVKDTDNVFASTGDGDMAIMIVRLGTSLDGYLHPQIRFINNGATVVAAKLEESPVQTLAHKEGDMWVLNDPPPDKTLEEMKCKARYIGGKLYGYVAAMYADAIAFSVPMGVTMNANPTLIGSDFGVYKQPGDIKEEGFSFMQAEARNGALLCMMSKPQHGFSASDTLVLYVGTGSGFSAEP